MATPVLAVDTPTPFALEEHTLSCTTCETEYFGYWFSSKVGIDYTEYYNIHPIDGYSSDNYWMYDDASDHPSFLVHDIEAEKRENRPNFSGICPSCLDELVATKGVPIGSNPSTDDRSIPVELTTEATTFSVTVPTSLPVNLSADGTVTVADNAVISNNSGGPVKVTGIQVNGKNTWEIVEPGKNYSNVAMDKHEIGLTLNSTNTPDGGGALTLDPTNWPAIAKAESQKLVYSATLPPQSTAFTTEIAEVIFTISWDLVE